MKRVALWIGPILATAIGLWVYQSELGSAAAWTAGVTVITAFWWITEPIPIAATSLIPIAMLPLVGALTSKQVAGAYGHEMILLLTGGFMLSKAMERSGTHRRIALGMVQLLGGENGRRLVLGFLTASAALSMWISNSATTLMLVPIGLAIIEKVSDHKLEVALLLAIAFGASIGGIGSPVGTPPNLIFMQNYEEATGEEISFLTWMKWSFPILLVMLPLTWLWLARNVRATEKIVLPEVGPWRTEEIRTLAVFATTAILWITRVEPWGGWSGWLNLPNANEASVAFLGVIAMFLIPNGKGERLLDWPTTVQIPWGVLLLFSGGVVIAEAFDQSGLSRALGHSLAGLQHLPVPLLILSVCLFTTFASELTNNTALANLLMPVMAALAEPCGVEHKVLMFPAAIAASYAFMMPAGTAPNAIVFGTDRITVREMAYEGFMLNLIGVVVVTVVSCALFWR
jgi:solute carrier family 13 (sodium-dependent dicarboxylate transporter), member 2/3/5